VPEKFDEQRPSFTYSHIKYDTRIQDHPLASRLPRATTRPAVVSQPAEFKSLGRTDATPTRLEDYLYSDLPQLCLHIVSFDNATLVTISWPHTLFDAMGRLALLNAWSLVLADREDEVLPFYGFDFDPLASLGSSPTEEFLLAKYVLAGLNKIIFIMRYVFELLWYRSESYRAVCLPAASMASLRATALADLAAENPSSETPFLSDGDVLSAWWARLIVRSLLPATSTKTIALRNVYGLRSLLSKDLLPADKAYVSNAVLSVIAMLPASDFFTKSLGFLAGEVRRSIREQGTRAQQENAAAISRERGIIAGPNSQMVIFSNWTKGRFFEFDCSPVVVKVGIPLEERANSLGRPSYLHANSCVNGFSPRFATPIFGKDEAGNYWLGSTLRTGTWEKIEKRLAEM
jgi:hypothetical protein